MARINTFKLTGLVILILGVTFFPIATRTSKAQQEGSRSAVAKRQELLERKLAQDRRQRELDRAIGNFKKTKELLIRKGVPFNPDILMTWDWRKTLAPHFAQMTEMQEVKIGPGKLKGVHLAHTIYLPERVELAGDTVILARNLIFEGRDAVMRGNFSIAVYPIDRVGLLGSTLEVALGRSGVRFINAGFSPAARSIPAYLPLIKNGRITIDTSGRGYKQWLEEHALANAGSQRFVKAMFVDDQNKNGRAGDPGIDALPGSDGATVLTTGAQGAGGTCGSTSSVNGGIGGNGASGNNGQRPALNGGKGQDGDDAQEIEFPIPEGSDTSYVLRARGGDGGPGGHGGSGGWGSKGGHGGQGGTGANCPCDQGGSGAGGRGGPGGSGGSGGDGSNGGQGGSGGNGADITVTAPASYQGDIQAYPNGGQKGFGGAAGLYGVHGNGGDGGSGGLSGGASSCLNQGFGGDTGARGSNGLDGQFGSDGLPGDHEGTRGVYRLRQSPPTYDPESPIIIDIDGNGFSLTDAAHGVNFDLNADGPAERLSWTAIGSDDSFLSLDLNQNGMIDSGAELFGNYTPQPPSASPNGFIALAEFDKEENGGNGNGQIDTGDAVYTRLLLWQDTNHDGWSNAGELRTLAQSEVKGISLDYRQSNRRDDYNNLFLYRSKIEAAKRSSVERWAYDIFLVRGQ